MLHFFRSAESLVGLLNEGMSHKKNPSTKTKDRQNPHIHLVTQLHTPQAADEGAPGAHAHPHGGLLSLLLHCPCLQVQNPSC